MVLWQTSICGMLPTRTAADAARPASLPTYARRLNRCSWMNSAISRSVGPRRATVVGYCVYVALCSIRAASYTQPPPPLNFHSSLAAFPEYPNSHNRSFDSGLHIEVVHNDYTRALREVRVPDDGHIIAFIAPRWGQAFSPSDGLDLRETTPPIPEIVDALSLLLSNPMLFAVQVVQNMVPDSLTELASRFDSSVLRLYDSNESGQNKNG